MWTAQPGTNPWPSGATENAPDPNPAASGDTRIIGAPVAPDPLPLTHSGDQPLSFVGPVLVADGADINSGKSNDPGPGMEVSGRYVQGAAGPNSGGTGMGDLAAETNQQPAATAIVDADDVRGEPTCGDSNMGRTHQYPDVPRQRGQPGVAIQANTIPDTVLGFPLPEATTFTEGYYGPAATARLNDLFTLKCDATWQFKPGSYWFHAPGPDFQLKFQDAGSISSLVISTLLLQQQCATSHLRRAQQSCWVLIPAFITPLAMYRSAVAQLTRSQRC